MVDQEQTLDQRRAGCQIWAHMLFWWILPFGWILSAHKMRYGLPVYVMLGAICLAVVTQPHGDVRNSNKLAENFAHGQKIGTVAGIIGSAMTVREILEARKRVNA